MKTITDKAIETAGAIKQLKESGFKVQKGKIFKGDIFGAVDRSQFPNCFDNNQDALYVVTSYPATPGCKILPPIIDVQTKTAKGGDSRFRMREDEAILFIGRTPPKCKYFSYTPYIYERYFEEDLKFREVFNSLGDPINNMTIRVKGESPFETLAVIVFVANETTKNNILVSLEEAGISDEIVNIAVVPMAMLNLGADFEDDILMTLTRIYGPDNSDELNDYVNNVPMDVMRITPGGNLDSMVPLALPKLRIRGTGVTETWLMPKMKTLRKNIISKYKEMGWKATEYITDQWLEEGFQALQANKNMFGEDRDVAYMCTESFTMYDNEFIVIFGVDHTLTEKAVYCSAAVYGDVYYNGVAGSNSNKWSSGAKQYLINDPDADKFFVLTACRPNEDGLTPSIPDQFFDGGEPTFKVPTEVKTSGIQKYAPIFIGFRNYLETATKSGPIPEELISPIVIKFSKPVYPPIE